MVDATEAQQAQTLYDAEDASSTPLLIAGAPLAASEGDAHSYTILRRKVPQVPHAWKARSWDDTAVACGDGVAAAQAMMEGLLITLGTDNVKLTAAAKPLPCLPVEPLAQCLSSCVAARWQTKATQLARQFSGP